MSQRNSARGLPVRRRVDNSVDDPRHDEDPFHDDEQIIGLTRQDRQRDQRKEEDRDFKLVAEEIAGEPARLGVGRGPRCARKPSGSRSRR